jgi:hypothetical protein
MSGISEQTWKIEKEIAQQSLASTGRLPTGDQLGGKFWDMVDTHYETAVRTDHLARFDYYHCPFVISVETSAHTPVLPVTHPTTPYVPPVQPVPPVPPVCHNPVPPSHPGHPGTPGGMPGGPIGSAVPEPSSLMLALPIVFVTGAWLVWKRMLRFAAV